MNVQRLCRHPAGWFASALQALADAGHYSNVFNPSLARFDGRWHLAFRAEAHPGEKPFRAFYTNAAADRFSPPLDLSAILAHEDFPRIADPKLVVLGERLYLTFNTGNLAGTDNALYLMQVWPTVGAPQRCEVEGRQTVEKNWAFYLDPQGELSVIYSLSPLVRLRRARGVLGSAGMLFFERAGSTDGPGKGLSIGTQITFANARTGYLVAHEKPGVLGKRGYVGRLVRLTFDHRGEAAVTVGGTRLIHSYRKLIPAKKRHNPNLLWATYFAGAVLDDNSELLSLSYGINDVEFGFAELPLAQLWK
ncbi:hypothetical protein [Povalibacter sp.]|uniref:hypothetical protein n=1 Tax=Povalibacter sp. TaxID=1962978 RepID=UPI002F426373